MDLAWACKVPGANCEWALHRRELEEEENEGRFRGGVRMENTEEGKQKEEKA
jgi:hypothetical protein